jgi:hypothetical protein
MMSRTGPSQVITTDAVFKGMPITPGSKCTLSDLQDCLESKPLGKPPRYGRGEEGTNDTRQHELAGGEEYEPPKNSERIRIKKGVRFSTSNYLAVTQEFRCWQIAGAVYGGILTELPRVVAEIWIERMTTAWAHPKSYHQRFRFNPDEVEDTADIFRERLETSLPGHDRMKFGVAKGKLEDVTITNQGFLFPKVHKASKRLEMFQDMAAGKAGNPVFTNSRRPPRAI